MLNPFGAPGEIVRMAGAGAVELCYDARMLSEYGKVLLRPRFPFSSDEVAALLGVIEGRGCLVSPRPLRDKLPDPMDAPFLEVAIAGQVRCLVTGNLKHYPRGIRAGMDVVSPAEFLEIYRRAAGSAR